MSSIVTEKEEVALGLFKEAIADVVPKLNWYQQTDVWLLRWLRARELDVNRAEDMFRKNQKFRVDEHLDKIMDWKVPKIIDEEFPMYAPGFDKDGCVIAVVPFGRWDVRRIVSIGMRKELLRYIDQIFENAMKFLEFKSTPDHIYSQFNLILDFEGFTFAQLASKDTIETVLEIIRRFEGNHPETLKSGWIINAPKIFEILFTFVKPLLTARTLAKVKVFGSNTESWRSALLKNIQPDQLPSQYGGSNSSVRPYKISQGYDLSTNYSTFPEDELATVLVEAGHKHLNQVFLMKGGQLSWNFKSHNYDIGFALSFQLELEREPVQLLYCARADSHMYCQKGNWIAEESGYYTVEFDNTFSRFRSKTLNYGVRVD